MIKQRHPLPLRGVVVVGILLVVAACARKSSEPAPKPKAAAPAPPAVSFIKDIHPIISRSCAQCHMGGAHKGEFSMSTREELLKGGTTGPAVVLGKSGESYLIQLVEGNGPTVMPMKGPRLSAEEIAALKKWIDAGLPWESGANLKKVDHPVAPLPPREVAAPPAARRWFFQRAASTNPVDRILAPYFKKRGVKPDAPVSDAVFARRAFLDVIGLPPTASQLAQFERDRSPKNREALVDRLLADKRGYAEHWMTFWNDMLRNDFQGTGYIDGGREQITGWLYTALADNMPYDQFVRELVSPNERSRGFVKGIVWRGVTNASQTPPMQASQNIGQVLMGTNLKCASCHDSFVNQWKLKDSYGLAAIYSDQPLELVRCDKPQGEMAVMHFLYPELGEIDASQPKEKRAARLAEVMTKRENGRLTRTIVNRVWAKFMGRGLVEPLDDMDQAPWNADVLDWLAVDFADHGYDLKRVMKWILTSEAYQLPAVPGAEVQPKDYVFRGPEVRRLTGEQFLDSLSLLTGAWQTTPASNFDLPAKLDPTNNTDAIKAREAEIRADLAKAKWIWSEEGAAASAPAESVYFRKTINLPEIKSRRPEESELYIACDNKFAVWVNGERIATGEEWNKPAVVALGPKLVDGENVIGIEGTNTAVGPAGLVFYARIRRGKEVLDFASDATWLWTRKKVFAWHKPETKIEGWNEAKIVADLKAAPWNIEDPLYAAVASGLSGKNNRLRAWLAKPDPLMVALGRPNREQVVTRRASVATTLEALELTNGATLTEFIRRGAEKVAETPADGSRGLAERLYRQALGRPPSREELRLAEETLGKTPTQEGLQDFLWSLAMSPEFQLIY